MKKTFVLFFVVLSLLLFSCNNNTPSVDETPSSPDNPPSEVVKYTVSFSGDVEGVESRTVEKGKAISLPKAIPLESAKTFKGWSTVKDDASFLIEADTYTPSGDITLYAIIVDSEHAWIYDFSSGVSRSCVLCDETQTIPEKDIVDVTVDGAMYKIDKQNKEAVYYQYIGNVKTVIVPATIDAAEGETYPVTSINEHAFFKSKPTSVTISEGIKAISREAFYTVGISSIKLPESLLYIGNGAFAYTNLGSLDIPKKVKALGDIYSIISADDDLKSITVAAENAYFKAEGGMLLSKDGKTLYAIVPSEEVRIPGTVKNVVGGLLVGCKNPKTLIIEDGVEYIGIVAFAECLILSSVKLPNTLTVISQGAFFNCGNLTSITIPMSVQEIRASAFKDCTGLNEFIYEGTTEGWGRIKLSKDNGTQNWATGVSCKVKCNDGVVDL